MARDIISFYNGKALTDEGLSINDIWTANTSFLENCHMHIQWLFPLKEASMMQHAAPTIDDAQVYEFKADPSLKARLVKSLLTMLRLYHLDLDVQGNDVKIKRSADFSISKARWIRKHDHNYLRITRMMKSMMMLGLPEYALALYECMKDIYDEVPLKFTPDNLAFWKDAVGLEPLPANLQHYKLSKKSAVPVTGFDLFKT